ncbi:MAG: hypothetical protein Q4G42_09540 [Neisseria sp.]|nr:hypothetical protein [Neisseria sp.]
MTKPSPLPTPADKPSYLTYTLVHLFFSIPLTLLLIFIGIGLFSSWNDAGWMIWGVLIVPVMTIPASVLFICLGYCAKKLQLRRNWQGILSSILLTALAYIIGNFIFYIIWLISGNADANDFGFAMIIGMFFAAASIIPSCLLALALPKECPLSEQESIKKQKNPYRAYILNHVFFSFPLLILMYFITQSVLSGFSFAGVWSSMGHKLFRMPVWIASIALLVTLAYWAKKLELKRNRADILISSLIVAILYTIAFLIGSAVNFIHLSSFLGQKALSVLNASYYLSILAFSIKMGFYGGLSSLILSQSLPTEE